MGGWRHVYFWWYRERFDKNAEVRPNVIKIGRRPFVQQNDAILKYINMLCYLFVCSQENGCLYSHIRWGEAFVIVYSVTCKRSFQEARGLLKQLADLRLPSYFTALLLGNKRDLDHARFVHHLYFLFSFFFFSANPPFSVGTADREVGCSRLPDQSSTQSTIYPAQLGPTFF